MRIGRRRSLQTVFAGFAIAGTAAVAATQQGAPAGARGATATLTIQALSTDPALVTGGDVLVQVTLPANAERPHVTVGGRDVSAGFGRPEGLPAEGRPEGLHYMGLVSGLQIGSNIIEVIAGSSRASLTVVNYPITGPVISGPWQQPFVCQTSAFRLPDGTTLGAPLDANCSARTVVQYVYRATGTPAEPRAWFKPMADTSRRPADVVMTTTSEGVSVPFIVRVETGTMNRGIYQNAILHDPTVEPAPTPLAPPKAWNRRLLAVHGSGCTGGWYDQGAALGVSVLDEARLAKGYGVFNNTLNHPSNSCNAFLAGETTMMGKEHFIETFGVPLYTISTGGSGGAYTSLQVADAFPGLIDGVDIRATFPDAFSIAASGLDARLLMHYFTATDPQGFTPEQQVATSGYHGMTAFLDAALQSARTDSVPDRRDLEGYASARFKTSVPAAQRYHPSANPRGARPTVFDAAKNIYGVDAATGAALWPWDNTGVQYGLVAFNNRTITAKQFLDLNERIGGVDRDANYTAARTVGDRGAIRRAYQAGLTLGANGGLKSIPIIDNATSNEQGRYHYGWFHFALRERVRQANGGSAASMMMWRSVSGDRAQRLFDQWVLAYKTDRTNDDQRTKMLRAKPAEAVDGCFDRAEPPAFIADALPFARTPVSKCSELYPVYSAPRIEAGGPLAADILKCQLKPVDARDYAVPLDAAEMARLKSIFPGGVCDWSKPGVEQTPVVTWASFGPSPKNRISVSAGGS